MIFLLAWLVVSVPVGLFVGRFIRVGAGPDIDHAEARALAALEELWRR